MGRFILFGFLIIVSNILSAQEYFQQKVDYNIQASLDTTQNVLDVELKMNYLNNSTDTLDKIILHLWWNASSDKTSPFAEQQFSLYNYDFHFSDEENLGSYKNFKISSSGQLLNPEKYQDEDRVLREVISVDLKDMILPGEEMEFTISYELIIPYAFSRFGYRNGLYRFTQWYPKPAVYDRTGWHPMTYLDQGEFYSEFGDYQVDVTLPISYSVASTGTKDESQNQFDLEKRTRTTRYISRRVHDFAFFTSEDYIPYRESMTIGDSLIGLNLFIKEDNASYDKLFNYMREAIKFLSDKIGDYPYPEVGVVEGDVFDSGMEYPMITILDMTGGDQQTDHLIAHEIGHNWFYGILASNERDFPWMDEGLTTFFDQSYNDLHYGHSNYDLLMPGYMQKRKRDYSLLQASVIELDRSKFAMPISTHSEDFDPLNYLSQNYEKMSWLFHYLQEYMGDNAFDQAIKSFYKKWKFKHPYPEDLQEAFELSSGLDLGWFFQDIINDNKSFDYSIKEIKDSNGEYNIIVNKKGSYRVPFSVSSYDENGQVVITQWYHSNNQSSQTLSFPQGDYKRISINGESTFLDKDRKNNHYFPRSILKKLRPVKINTLSGLEASHQNTLNIYPALLFNSYDGLMGGVSFNNDALPLQSTRWTFSPMYGFGSGELNYFAALEKDFDISSAKIRKLSLNLMSQKFSYFENESLDYKLNYIKWSPAVKLHFANSIYNNGYLEYRLHHLRTDNALFTDASSFDIVRSNRNIHQLNLVKYNKRRLTDLYFKAQVEYESYKLLSGDDAEYLKLSFERKWDIAYSRDNHFFLRFFGAYFPINTQRESSNFSNGLTFGSLALTAQGFTDHTFEEYYFQRSSSHQITEADGGFKNALGPAFNVGMSNDYLVALNLKFDLPWQFSQDLKIRPYFDMALSSTKSFSTDELSSEIFYSGGIAFEISEVFGLYFPLVNSEVLQQSYSGDNLFAMMSFKFDIRPLSAWRLSDRPVNLLKAND